MIHRIGPRGRAARRAGLTLTALLLAGCSGAPSVWPFGRAETAGANAAPGPVTTVASSDPVVIFAARSQPGTAERITLADGQPASARVVRAYISGNGRECREVLVSAGMAERNRVICAAETGWAETRPLLRGGAGRP